MMHSLGHIYIIFWLLIFAVIRSESINSESSAKRSLDSLLQEYAFKALAWPKTKTGTAYEGFVPSHLTGIKISALMLRRDSLQWRGYGYYSEFLIPTGVIEEPYVTRIVLVYQNIGNWSSYYYPLPGYIYLTPVLGILAYDAMNMCAKNKSELNIHALKNPINIRFNNVQPAPEGCLLKCIHFYSNNSVEFSNATDGNVCTTRVGGHFSIAAALKVAPSPAPSADGNNNTLGSKMLTISVGFLIFAVLGILFVVAKKFVYVERRVLLMEDSAAIIEPLLGAAVAQAEDPLLEEGPSRRFLENDYAIRPLPEKDYAIRPLPENDYVPENEFVPENNYVQEYDNVPENDLAL